MKIISSTDSLVALVILCDQFQQGFGPEIDLTPLHYILTNDDGIQNRTEIGAHPAWIWSQRRVSRS